MKTDKEYERQRNVLIPEAEKYANKECGVNKGEMGEEKRTAKWNHCFHTKMNQLWKEKGK